MALGVKTVKIFKGQIDDHQLGARLANRSHMDMTRRDEQQIVLIMPYFPKQVQLAIRIAYIVVLYGKHHADIRVGVPYPDFPCLRGRAGIMRKMNALK